MRILFFEKSTVFMMLNENYINLYVFEINQLYFMIDAFVNF